jgi:O-antigen ligase
MGYVFYLESGGFKLSLRIALWLIIMAVFLSKFLLELIKEKKASLIKYLQIPYLKNWLFLFFFVLLGLILGIFRNGFSDAFFDFNAWLYLALIFPLAYILSVNSFSQKFKENIILIFLASVLFVSLKSLVLLFIFSHNVQGLIFDLYYWTRKYYLGEVTAMGSGFHRVFLQSQIYSLFAFIIALSAWIFSPTKKSRFYLMAFLSLLASTLILSFSRSFWLGLVLGLALLFLILWIRFGFKKMLTTMIVSISSFVIGFLIVVLVIKFPWPKSTADFDLNSLSSRANISVNESAISSRWALLEVMKEDISGNFLWGRGFGARLEYPSSDPRVLEQTADGIYSTYAFEWGWFDIWLKLGVFGLISYLFIFWVVLRNLWINFKDSKNFIYLGLILSLISLMAVNVFTPYLNHPLGIGFLLLVVLLWLKKYPKLFENER